MHQPRQATGPHSKPGAMTAAMAAVAQRPTGPKVLRIGLIQGGKIVEERIVRQRETVSVGTSEKNHFIIPADALPSRFELFQLVGDNYILNFTDEMSGRVGLPGGVQELTDLRTKGGARNAGSHWQVKLNDQSRGKVVIGDTTLLFQFVVPPPVTPRPQLPAAARGGFLKSIDWLFTAFVVFSLMLFSGGIIYLENADWPIQQGIASLPSAAARYIFIPQEEPPEEEEPTEEEDAEEEPAEEEVAEQVRQPRERTPSPARQESAETSAERTARIGQEARQQAEALIVGVESEIRGALDNVLSQGALTGQAEEIMSEASGVGVAQRGTSGRLTRRSGGGGSGEQRGLGALRETQGASRQAQEGGAVQEAEVRGNVAIQGGFATGGSGEFAQGQVTSAIQRRTRAFRTCYERALRNNPSLRGKVTVQFTIVPAGTVAGASAVENTTGDAGLASCVVSTVQRLRWSPGPEGGNVTFRYPFVFAPQN